MLNRSVVEDIEKESFRIWPLFRQFRNRLEFARAYEKAFGEKYVADPKEDIPELEETLKTGEDPKKRSGETEAGS